jgi:hypothetical protein
LEGSPQSLAASLYRLQFSAAADVMIEMILTRTRQQEFGDVSFQ